MNILFKKQKEHIGHMTGSNQSMNLKMQSLLIHIFDILTDQGVLTKEENYCLKIELDDCICSKKEEHDKSRNI